MVSEGDLVVVDLPQSDGRVKLRPVLLLRKLPGYGDFLGCGISTQVNQFETNFDVMLLSEDNHFPETGLRETSVVRLNFLASIPTRRLKRHLGKVSRQVLQLLQTNLADHLISQHRL